MLLSSLRRASLLPLLTAACWLPTAAEAAFTPIKAIAEPVSRDWLDTLTEQQRADGVAVMPIRPAPGQSVTQNPPAFSWPLHKLRTATQAINYKLQIRFPDGSVRTHYLNTNWYLAREHYPAGSYRWRVTGGFMGENGTHDYGTWRSFAIASKAQDVFDPGKLVDAKTDAAWFKAVVATPHPRIVTEAYLDQLRPYILGERRAAWDALVGRVRQQVELNSPSSQPADSALKTVTEVEETRMEDAILVWRMWRSSGVSTERQLANDALADAKSRLLQLMRWDTVKLDGRDSNTDIPVRNLLWTLTLGYDHLYSALSSSERDALLRAIAVRAKQAQDRVIGPFRALERMPLDSHATASLVALAATTAVMAGDGGNDVTQFNQSQFARLVPFAYTFIHPWGAADGAHGNGGGYAEWFMDENFPYLDALHAVTGANPYRLQQMRNYAIYRLYSIPYGKLHAPFGDGAVIEGYQVNYYAYWLATRMPGPATNWMATVLPVNGKHDPLSRTLLSPPVSPPKTASPGRSTSAAYFPSTGQVSMHSSLTDPDRTTIHFKSSAFGSVNHSHADQNHFIVGSQGKALLIDSGYYDYYLSPHGKAWYRQTKAHNAITYDGGTGQRTAIEKLPTDYSATGRITGYQDGGDFVMVTGDASAAYDADTVTRAVRSLVYIKPGLILVHDDLLAKRPIRWEWNFHSLNAPLITGGALGSVKLVNETATLCMRQIGGNRFDALSVTDQFPVNPVKSNFKPQFHGTWRANTARQQHQSLMLIDVGCQLTRIPTAVHDGVYITVTVDGRSFRFAPNTLPSYTAQ
ncbi:heparinase II/III domain-containing protein [Chitinolyticbacter meiyuanensis]|uniref:heparinase II/III domain-containing protein n=1 Tax=Chitinolyticbacter meiyuanensis TaxID=682798 RepID=UPI0011E58E01|nr:heparinase II/III family protein [Chitinolyticbacter meiyuanensis]